MTDLANETLYIRNIITQALESFDGTPYAMTKHDKARAQKVLVVKKPNREGHNVSRANHDLISINLAYWQIKNVISGKYENGHKCFEHKVLDGHVYWNEYRLFDSNERCGGMFVKVGDVDHGNLIQVLHELAHYIQFTLYKRDRRRWSYMRKTHGEGFCMLYSKMRDKFCNDPDVRTKFIDVMQPGLEYV
jgi:hypothetical protein